MRPFCHTQRSCIFFFLSLPAPKPSPKEFIEIAARMFPLLIETVRSKHLFVPNFANVEAGYTVVTEENRPLIESCYEARKENELAVLIQYIDRAKLQPPQAAFLDVILYSREQIIKENLAMGTAPPDTTAPWGIISIKGEMVDHETPMQPITMMRNALGKEFGGSGVPLDFEKYRHSVAFWTKHVAIK